MTDRLKVLWVDDECKDEDFGYTVVRLAKKAGIELIGCKSAESALEKLKNPADYDAVVLDGWFYEKENDVGSLSASKDNAFLQVANRLRELPVNENLPWAILSGNKDFTEQKKRYIIIYGEKSGYVDFFNKESNDIKNLWEKIIEAVEGLPDTKIKREHQKAFEMCREYLDEKSPQRLLKAIKKAEWIESDMDYTDSFLVLRKILEQLFKKLNHIGLIPDEIYDSKGWINPSFDIISDAEKNGFKIEQGLIHPTIGFLLKQLKPVTQDAEHGNNEKLGLKVDDFVTNSKTPYLYRSSLNQLLEVLAWFKKFIDEHPNKEDNKKLYVRVEPEYIGKIEKDNNIYHCGQYVLYPKYVEENNYKIGDEIAITKSKDNTNKHTKERYPKYADRFNKS